MLLQSVTSPGRLARSIAVLLSIWAFIFIFSPFSFRLDKNNINYDDEAIWDSSLSRHDICRLYGWKPYQPRQPSDPPRKTYDLVLVTTELDLLEVRLNSTWDAIDYYVLVESSKTFTGRNKPLLLKRALGQTPSRFEAYKSKIIYHKVEHPDNFNSPPPTSSTGSQSAWQDFQLNAMFDQVFPSLSTETTSSTTSPDLDSDLHSSYPASLTHSTKNTTTSKLPSPRRPQQNDIILLSLASEIPRPRTLGLLKECFFPDRLTLSSKMHYYSFQFVRRPSWFSPTHEYGPGYLDRESSKEVEWPHPQATVYRGLDKTVRMGGKGGLRYGSGNGNGNGDERSSGKGWCMGGWLRLNGWIEKCAAKWLGGERQTLHNASWTCEGCFPTVAEFLLKNEEVYGPSTRHRLGADALGSSAVERERIVRYVREGKDLWADLHEQQSQTGEKSWVFEEVVNNTDVPSSLRGSSEGQEGGRLRYLMERGTRDGGFRDYETPRWEEGVEGGYEKVLGKL
ncbi:hypothetical protein B0T20DRAFT_464747 [Sordaria brevicollis]|uniref:Glycosyltransferase family 17 protein n=1 Tax=Sordaria brevicollis TaxID=83679 RepID=A0AAE0NWL7_SORBR|nr:hypothetical protein B0T20DRAFT_464747 [Sordaria brevicollis]